MSKVKKFALALVAALIMGGVAAAPALAAFFQAGHPSDPSVAQADTQIGIRACDRQVDGHSVRAWSRLSTSDSGSPVTGFAPSGGCTGWTPQNATQMRICVEAEGCGPWTRSFP